MKIKKTMKAVLGCLLCVLLLSSFVIPAFADDPGSGWVYGREGDWDYAIKNGEATITGYYGGDSTLMVPSSLGGCPVVWIGDYVLSGKDSIEEIILPDSITHLGAYAMEHCENLQNVQLSDNLVEIPLGCFSNCVSLEEITIPQSVTEIGIDAFGDCTALERVMFRPPMHLHTICTTAFSGCTSLASIVLPDSLRMLGRLDWTGDHYGQRTHVYLDDNQVFIRCPALKNIFIPSTVTDIPCYTAYTYEQEIYFGVVPENPQTATSPSGQAFANHSGTQVPWVFGVAEELPAGTETELQYIWSDSSTGVAADFARALEQGGCAEFRVYGTEYTEGDWNFVVTDGAAAITGYSGSGGAVAVPETICGFPVVAIRGTAIFGGAALSLTIPKTVREISDDAFLSANVTSVTVDSLNPLFSSDANGVLYDWDKRYLLYYPSGRTQTSFEVSSTVWGIGNNAFASANLTQITLPNGLVGIGETAFVMSALESITLPETLTTIGPMAFGGCASLGADGVHIPSSVTTIGGGAFSMCTSLAFLCAEDANGVAAQFAQNAGIEFRVCGSGSVDPPDQISVTIDDQIGVNLYLNLDARNAQSVTVSYHDLDGTPKEETITDFGSLPQVEGGLYRLQVRIAPAQIAETVTVTIDGDELATNVQEYCETLIAGDYSAEVKALAQAMLDYGQTANNYFDYSDAQISTLSGLSADAANAWTYRLSDTTGKLQNASFMALTQPEFRFYMRDMDEAEAAQYNNNGAISVSYADPTVTDVLSARFVKNSNGILLEVKGVMAEHMDETIEVTIDGLGTITFAGNDFAKLMLGNAVTQPLGAALFTYGAAAKACFAEDPLETVGDSMEVPLPDPIDPSGGNTP